MLGCGDGCDDDEDADDDVDRSTPDQLLPKYAGSISNSHSIPLQCLITSADLNDNNQ